MLGLELVEQRYAVLSFAFVLLNLWLVKILSSALLNCHQAAAEAGHKFALEEFTSGRNRLENEGAKAMAEVFEVGKCCYVLVLNERCGSRYWEH